jgi:hypothetical protein
MEVVPYKKMKRKRTKSDIARAINMKYASKYPYAEYGRMYVKRGTETNLGRFGASYKAANSDQRQARKNFGYIGRGSYASRAGKALYQFSKAAAPGAGKFVGNYIAGPAGAEIGYRLGKKYSGMGAYATNALVDGVGGRGIMGVGDESGSIVISRTEYIKDLYAPSDGSFTLQAYDLNPGLEGTFSWLSQTACNFEEYEMQQLVFEYRSKVEATNNTSGNLGTVIMATNDNPAAPLYSSKQQMMEVVNGTSTKPTVSVVHGVEADPSRRSGSAGKYVRTSVGAYLEGDIKDYDMGTFQIAMVDMPTEFQDKLVGELWVTYTVKLRKPRYFSAAGLSIQQDLFGYWHKDGSHFNNNAAHSEWTYKFYAAKNNSLGCSMSYGGAAHCYTVTFPSSYDGYIEIINQFKSLDEFNVATASVDADGPVFVKEHTGNVFAFHDNICGLVHNSGGTHSHNYHISAQESSPDGGLCIGITRLRVKPSTNGVLNSVTFDAAKCKSDQMASWTIAIREFNSGFSRLQQEKGSADQRIPFLDNGLEVQMPHESTVTLP